MSVEFPHVRAEDHQHVGYLRMTEDDEFVPVDLLRRPCGPPSGLEEAEGVLEEIGLRVLDRDWLLTTPGAPDVLVGIQEIGTDDVIVAPLDGGTSGHVAKSVDMVRAVRLPLPTSRLREAG